MYKQILIVVLLILSLSAGFNAASHEHHGHCESLLTRVIEPSSPLKTAFERANTQVDAIEKYVKSTDFPAATEILQAVKATFTKHHDVFKDTKVWSKLDVARHYAILQAIGDFNETKPRFSLYKIKRAIEGRHSLSEYINCK